MCLMGLQGEVPGGGEWAHTIHDSKEETETVFAETLQSQELKPCVWEGQLETAHSGLIHGSSQDGEGCIISGILCKGPSWPVVLQLQNQCIALEPGGDDFPSGRCHGLLALNQVSAWRGTGDDW